MLSRTGQRLQGQEDDARDESSNSWVSARQVVSVVVVIAGLLVGLGVAFSFGPMVVRGRAVANLKLLPLAVSPTSSGGKFIPGSALSAVALDISEMGSLLRKELDWSRDVSAPGVDAKTSVPECQPADPVGTLSGYGEDWATFRKTTAQPAEDDDSTQVVLVVGLYPTEAKARGRFGKLAAAVRACDGKTVTQTGSDDTESALLFQFDPAEADSVQWSSRRTVFAARSCSYDTRSRRNALLQVMVCVNSVADQSGQPGAKTVADALEAKLPQ